MIYYYYTFSVKGNNDEIRNIIKYMKRKNYDYEWFHPFFHDLFMLDTAELDGGFVLKSDGFEEMYIYSDSMLELSRQFPKNAFCIYISYDGLEFFLDYFKNGKIQHCLPNITFDEFNESKLETIE